MKVVILAPRRADGGGHRDRLWSFARRRWETDFPDWPIIEGHHDDGPFNRSAAVNRAAAEAGEWDVALIIDCDVLANARAVADAVEIAAATDRLVVSHDERVMLNKVGTDKVLGGYVGSWRDRRMVETVYTDSVSCAVAVSRTAWDVVGGFDERVVGWGYEDSMFEIAVSTLVGKPYVRLSSELFHLWHPTSPEAAKDSPTRRANQARFERYKLAAGDVDAMRHLLDEPLVPPDLGGTRIPRILHRTVPTETTEQVERWWKDFARLHPSWEMRTHRDPLHPADWPLTSDLWKRCRNGAQLAGLIRLEALVTHGGVYVDSDVEPVRSFEPLLHLPAFAAWEDETTVPDAVLGCEAGHPAFLLLLDKARAVLQGGGDAWQSGPGVCTEVLPGRRDVLVLPPGAFYPHHYLQKSKLKEPHQPYEFARHHWHGSWLDDKQRRSIEDRQRA